MEALGLPCLKTLALTSSYRYHGKNTTEAFLNLPLPCCFLKPRTRTAASNLYNRRSVVRMVVDTDDYDLKQMRDMAAARKRWDALIRNGKVKVLTPKEAGYAIQLSDKPLLDVRPSIEHNKAWVKGSTWIPIFDSDDSFDAGILSRKITNFMMGGWWSGAPTLSYNKQFLAKVEEKFPKDADLIVACQKGLRSLAACEVLSNAGYRNLFWVQGGLEAAEEEDLITEGSQPLKFAGIGGLSEFLGWTDQQRVAAAKEGLAYRLVFSARLIGLIIAADALFIGAQQRRSVVRMVVDTDDYDLKQMRDMAAARKRWDALPWVKGSTWIPIFDSDNSFDAGILSRKITNFMMGGWWSGAPTLSYSKQFLAKVEEKFPKDADLIVACQKGLRSLAACEVLSNAGYRNLFWVQGGLEAAEEEDLITEGSQPLKFAGIGGLSEFLGWTDQQRAAAAKEGWAYRLVFSACLIGLIIAADAYLLVLSKWAVTFRR